MAFARDALVLVEISQCTALLTYCSNHSYRRDKRIWFWELPFERLKYIDPSHYGAGVLSTNL